jgi:8-oxo-dGTP pyrophosphatase MutT (NUDIX family)
MAHYHYALDLCIESFIVNDGAVLLRLHEKYSIWTGPGGHIDPGEDSNEAAHREIWEESGLEVELVGPLGWVKTDTEHNIDLVPPLFLNRHHINSHHDHSCMIFAARSKSREISPQTEEDRDCEFVWVTAATLAEMHKTDKRLRDEVYRYAIEALKVTSN